MRFMIFLAASAYSAICQTGTPREFVIEVDKTVLYLNDTPDYARLAAIATPTVRAVSRNFAHGVFLGDIVSVNGKPARGTYVARIANINLNPIPQSGQAISDATRGAFMETLVLEIAEAESTTVGTLVASGFWGGPPPPGSTGTNATWNVAVEGGTGAFLGVRGWLVFELVRVVRAASATEDPAARRLFDGGYLRLRVGLNR